MGGIRKTLFPLSRLPSPEFAQGGGLQQVADSAGPGQGSCQPQELIRFRAGRSSVDKVGNISPHMVETVAQPARQGRQTNGADDNA